MRVTVGNTFWIVPPTRAIWIPAGTCHEIEAKGEVALRTLYVAAERGQSVGRSIGAFEISPLLAQLILHILDERMLDPNVPAHDRLVGVLTDLIGAASSIDLALPLPADARASRLARHFQTRPDDKSPLPVLAKQAGASIRTLQRCFLAETGMTIDAWRQKVRLVSSTAQLASGSSVTQAALDCGYDSPSAFIAAFKRQFSMTPKQFAKSG